MQQLRGVNLLGISELDDERPALLYRLQADYDLRDEESVPVPGPRGGLPAQLVTIKEDNIEAFGAVEREGVQDFVVGCDRGRERTETVIG